MCNWQVDDLQLSIDNVLRGQGADPDIVRLHRPRIVEIAARALEEGSTLLNPQSIIYETEIESVRHNILVLDGGKSLSGKLVSEHLSLCERVVIILCTVGEALETYATSVSKKNMVFGLALDGLGSAAVGSLATAICKQLEDQAAKRGFQTFNPISPGMVGWPVDIGQSEIFSILEPAKINVRLTEYDLILPRKSLTMVLGLGKTMNAVGRTCDYCAMRETCRYQDNHGTNIR